MEESVKVKSRGFVPAVARTPVRKLRPSRLRSTAALVFRPSRHIAVDWSASQRNWGDALNRYLLEKLSGKRVICARDVFVPLWQQRLVAIGSVLGYSNLSRSTVWGSGFISADSAPNGQPRSVAALRGPLSAAMLVNSGVSLPIVVPYGDPAILIRRVYDPEIKVEFRCGIVKHYADDLGPVYERMGRREDVLLIDPYLDIESFVRSVRSCEFIASSSLHGLIAADAYEVPRVWIRSNQDVVGDGFKFVDYFLGARLPVASRLDHLLDVERMERLATVAAVPDEVLAELLRSCPFLDGDQIERWTAADRAQ